MIERETNRDYLIQKRGDKKNSKTYDFQKYKTISSS